VCCTCGLSLPHLGCSQCQSAKGLKNLAAIRFSDGRLCRSMCQTIKVTTFFPSTTLHDFYSACGTTTKKVKQNACVSKNFSAIYNSAFSSQLEKAALSDHYENNKCQSVGVTLFVHLLSYPAHRVFHSASPLQTSPIFAVSNGDRIVSG